MGSGGGLVGSFDVGLGRQRTMGRKRRELGYARAPMEAPGEPREVELRCPEENIEPIKIEFSCPSKIFITSGEIAVCSSAEIHFPPAYEVEGSAAE